HDRIAKAVAAMLAVGTGPGIDQAADFLSQISGGAQALFPDLMKAVEDFAANAKKVGMETQFAKMMIIVLSAMLLYMIFELLKWAFFTGGATAEAIPAVIETFQEVAKRFLIQLLIKAAIAGSIAFSMDFALQAIQKWGLHTRQDIDWGEAGKMAGVAALGA